MAAVPDRARVPRPTAGDVSVTLEYEGSEAWARAQDVADPLGHHRHGFRGAGIVGGIIAGALIAGAIRESRAGSSDIERCESAYRSFDADTGTYMGYDGERHVCPYLE